MKFSVYTKLWTLDALTVYPAVFARRKVLSILPMDTIGEVFILTRRWKPNKENTWASMAKARHFSRVLVQETARVGHAHCIVNCYLKKLNLVKISTSYRGLAYSEIFSHKIFLAYEVMHASMCLLVIIYLCLLWHKYYSCIIWFFKTGVQSTSSVVINRTPGYYVSEYSWMLCVVDQVNYLGFVFSRKVVYWAVQKWY